jgi:hypothetical protein
MHANAHHGNFLTSRGINPRLLQILRLRLAGPEPRLNAPYLPAAYTAKTAA